MKNNFLMLVLLFAAPLMLSACAGALVAGGAVVGVKATQEGGISSAFSDAKIQVQINDAWFKYNVDMFGKLDLTIDQGRVLITGVVQDPDQRVEAVRLAWQPKGVKQVINEIRVADSDGIVGYAKDKWIITKLRAKILYNKEIQSLNYSLDAVQGTVYLMGSAQNEEELELVISTARTTRHVKRVVSYVKMVGASIESDG